MIDEFRQFILQHELVKPGSKVLVAVSGGIDSMVMARLFLELGTDIGIAHCNFCLRGQESDMDEEHVSQFAHKHDIPFYTIRFETKKIASERKISVQMAARDLRYEWFEKIKRAEGYNCIAIAHNLNDNIETLLINLTRGTGLAGMTGIKVSGNGIIRPLLFATREMIDKYCHENKILYREDRSNAETTYTRNKIRHLVIPVLKEINPSIEQTLNDTADRFSEFNDILSDYISGLKKEMFSIDGQYAIFNVSRLKVYLHNHTILFELFRSYGITGSLLSDLESVIRGRTGGKIHTATHRIIKNRSELIVTEIADQLESIYTLADVSSLRETPGIISASVVEIDETFKITSDNDIACMDAEKVNFPLIIRKWKNGDHFHPLGMNKRKLLSDYFIDKKYSVFDKENIRILESHGKIVWIIGERIDNRVRITPSTKKVLVIKSAPRV